MKAWWVDSLDHVFQNAKAGNGQTQWTIRAARNEVEHADLDPDSIDPSPFQPRLPESFPAAEIEDLARSIRAEGLLHPILVRPGRSPGRYELIDGERRWRACRLPASGQRTIRAEVQRRTDAEVRRGILVIREQDKPFNAVELARAYRRLVADGDAATDAEAARMIGVAASQFANVTGLLDLPENVQALVISREMTVTQARDLTTYARKVPAIMPALLKKLPKRPAELGTREFQQCLGNALRNLSKPLSGQEPWGKGYDYYEVFKPTPEQREELACVKVPRSYGPPEERATNVLLWNRLQGEQVKRIIEKEEKSGERKAESGKRKSDNRQPTTAEKKAQAKREAQRRAEQARLVARRVWGWKIMRLRAAAAAAFANAAPVVRDQIGLYFLVSASAWSLSTSSEFYRRRGDREELYAKVAGSRGRGEGFPLGAIRERGSAHVAGDATAVVAALLWEEPDGGHTEIPDGDVLGIAEMLAIDLAALWKADQKGDWGREYFELHSKEQLVGLVAEGYPKGGGLFFGVAEKKDKMIRLLQASPKLLPLPKELSRAKGVKNAK
jgi:ParB/RepB/Spo0J family partition protein